VKTNSQIGFVIVLASLLLLAFAPCANAGLLTVSLSDELKIGKDFYDTYSKEHKYLDNTVEGKRVKQVGLKLVKSNAVTDYTFTFTLVDDKEVNAFSVPGGYVFINKGLYDYLSYDEAMLAAVIGHEMTHVRERHYKQMYDKAAKSELGVLAAGLIIGGDKGQTVADALGVGNSLIFLKYSRDDEEHADRGGIVLALGAGYDPYGMVRDMRLFQALESKLGQNELFDLWRTHPQPAERIARCASIAKELSGKDESAYHPPTPPAGYDYGNGVSSNPDLLAPTSVTATDGAYADRIRITWKPSKGAASYEVYRATSQNGDYTVLSQSGTTSYDDYVNGTATYWYKIKAINSNGGSVFSVADSGYQKGGTQQPSSLTVPPSPPTDVAASDGTYANMVRITWTAINGATSYKVYRSASKGGNYAYIGESTSTAYDDNVKSSNSFWYKVRAINNYGGRGYSNADSGYRSRGASQQNPQTNLPSAPAGVAASDGTYADMVRVSWTASAGATSYKVYRATSQNGNYIYIGQISSTFYEDYANDSSAYWYKVRAINAKGGSGYSSADSGYMGSGSQLLSPPDNVSASDGTYTDAVRITWTESDGATNYKVYRAASENGNYAFIGQSNSSPYDDYDSGTSTYWYVVKASNSNGDSDYSNADSGYKQNAQQQPDSPDNVSASDGTYVDAVRITWTESDGATNYKVYRATSQNGNYAYIGQANSPPYDDYDSSMGTYWYMVKASNSYGDSEYSGADSGYKGSGSEQQNPSANPPNPPTSVSASDGDYTDMVRITWTESNGAVSYKVYRANSQSGNYSYIGQTSYSFYEDYVNGTSAYWYKVRAINAYGGSGYSNADRGNVQ
jgi:fibronectin type 3 domain-containing protein